MPTEKERHERLFVGVPVTTGARDELAKRLPKSIPGKAVPPDNWHVTLRFLGQTAREQRDLFVTSLQNTTLPTAFRIAFTGLGAFRTRGVRRFYGSVSAAERNRSSSSPRSWSERQSLQALRRSHDAFIHTLRLLGSIQQ
jgi:2'-5' RNA ligase